MNISKSSLLAIYLTVFIDILGFSIILPMLPYYAQHFGANGTQVGMLLTSYSLAQFIGAILIGRLSDRYGRRPVLLWCLVGSALSFLLLASAQSLLMIFLSRSLAGFFGGAIATAQAYISDVTNKKERTKYMGFLGACIGSAFVFGPAIGALLMTWGFAFVSYFSALVCGLNFILAYFRVKESHHERSERAHLTWHKVSEILRRPSLGLLLVTLFASMTAFVSMEATYAIMAKLRYGIDAKEMGIILSICGVVMVVVQGGLVGKLSKRIGEKFTGMLGISLIVVTLFILPFTPTILWSTFILALMSFGQGMTNPVLYSLLSHSTTGEDKGAVMGLGQSLGALARSVGPMIGGWCFDQVYYLSYIVAGLISFAALIVLSRVKKI